MSEGTANNHPKPTNTSFNEIVYCFHFNSHLHLFERVTQSRHHELAVGATAPGETVIDPSVDLC